MSPVKYDVTNFLNVVKVLIISNINYQVLAQNLPVFIPDALYLSVNLSAFSNVKI